MEKYFFEVQVRWADLDPNFHTRHSVYYDWGAMCRIAYLHNNGLTIDLMTKLHIGPILFREECVFKREIQGPNTVTVQLELLKARRDYSRWTIQHNIIKDELTLAAVLTCDGAWIDTIQRKLATLPAEAAQVFADMPKHKDFSWSD